MITAKPFLNNTDQMNCSEQEFNQLLLRLLVGLKPEILLTLLKHQHILPNMLKMNQLKLKVMQKLSTSQLILALMI